MPTIFEYLSKRVEASVRTAFTPAVPVTVSIIPDAAFATASDIFLSMSLLRAAKVSEVLASSLLASSIASSGLSLSRRSVSLYSSIKALRLSLVTKACLMFLLLLKYL